MGVNFFGEIAPDDFGSYDLAFVTIFTMTAGNSWVALPSTALFCFQIRSPVAAFKPSFFLSVDVVTDDSLTVLTLKSRCVAIRLRCRSDPSRG
jgi:hypothetical protein